MHACSIFLFLHAVAEWILKVKDTKGCNCNTGAFKLDSLESNKPIFDKLISSRLALAISDLVS